MHGPEERGEKRRRLKEVPSLVGIDGPKGEKKNQGGVCKCQPRLQLFIGVWADVS